jgi:hypothetical protein
MNKIIFENTVLAILKASPHLGSVQLRKALVLADALHFQLHGKSLTDVYYIKHKYGPVPEKEAFIALSQMEPPFDNKLDRIEKMKGLCTQIDYTATAEPDYTLFRQDQIDIINFAARTARKYNATLLSYMTHDETYNRLPMGAKIELSDICSLQTSGYETEPMTPKERAVVEEFFKSDEASLYNFC